jgi:Flp pilus assembly protein CpaB
VNPKIVLALAVVAGLLAVFMVQRHVDNVRGESITVYKSAVDAKAGDVLGSAVEEIDIPSGMFPSLLEEAPTAELLGYIQTAPLRVGVQAGDILLFRHFDASVDPGVLPEIPPGMKAISIPAGQIDSVSYFIKPGDQVDVLGTFMGSDRSPGGAEQNSDLFEVSTRPILQAVRVLAVGEQYRPAERQVIEPYSSITLLVTPEEAAKLIFARDFFNVTMTLVLRGENDPEVLEDYPTIGVETLNFHDIGNAPRPAPAAVSDTDG